MSAVPLNHNTFDSLEFSSQGKIISFKIERDSNFGKKIKSVLLLT